MARIQDTRRTTPAHGNMVKRRNCTPALDFCVLDLVLMLLLVKFKIWEVFFTSLFCPFSVLLNLFVLNRIERKIATISLESRDGPGRLGESERGKNVLEGFFSLLFLFTLF